MDITPLVKSGVQIIQSYKDGVFKISGQTYAHNVLVTAQDTTKFDVAAFDELTPKSFDVFAQRQEDVDIILFGTGAEQVFFPPEIMSSLAQRNIHMDIMDTGAACRTFNVLISEGRRVMAALMQLDT